MRQHIKTYLLTILLAAPMLGCAQQRVDNDFTPVITRPLYERGKGPLILVDGGHSNFHTLDDKFAPFGKIAAMDGYNVQGTTAAITAATLKNAKILVIANALNEQNVDSWQLPVHPAFTKEEVALITDWVHGGGRLFLLADHMPFPGAVADLAQALGYTFYNGFALCKPKRKMDVFSYAEGTLSHNKLTDLHGSIDSIITFTGQAFNIPQGATSVITLGGNYKVLMPKVAWEFDSTMQIKDAKGLSQLAYSTYGAGKVVVSGEAAMFTAQIAGSSNRMGLNSPDARHNVQLLRNVLEWLAE